MEDNEQKADILSPATRQKLEALKTDAATNFLNGQETTGFAGKAAIKTASAAANVVGTTMQSAGLSATITAEALAYIQTASLEMVANAVTEIAKFPADKIAAATTEFVANNIMSISDITKELTEGIDKIAEEALNTASKAAEKAMQGSAGEKIKNINDKSKKVLDNSTEKLNMISAYITKGPDWIENNLAKFAYTTLTQLQGLLTKEVEDANEQKDAAAKGIGESIGANTVEKTNATAKQSVKDKLDKVEQTKTSLQSKIKAITAAAVMKIKGLLGG